MNSSIKKFPLDVKLSFHKILEKYKAQDYMMESFSALIEKVEKKYPILIEGVDYNELFIKKYKGIIQEILNPLFPFALTDDEIKAAILPFKNQCISTSRQLENLLHSSQTTFNLGYDQIPDKNLYLMQCCLILSIYYKKPVHFFPDFLFHLPGKDGLLKHYRVLHNVEFCEIIKTNLSVDITQKDVDKLIDNFENIELWKEKFPPGSWLIKGLAIVNLFDITNQVVLSEFKTLLLAGDQSNENSEKIKNIFRSIFKMPHIDIGYTNFYNNTLKRNEIKSINSYLLQHYVLANAKDIFCDYSFDTLIVQQKPFVISNIENNYKKGGKAHEYIKNLYETGVKSAIIAPVVENKDIFGFIEVVSKEKYKLNKVNAYLLEQIMPDLINAVQLSRFLENSSISNIIQKECTSIHPSVYWRFEEEARKVYEDKIENKTTRFGDIVFKEIIPLYGQVDIKDSSITRNYVTKEDLTAQLQQVINILNQANQLKELPAYEELLYRTCLFLEQLKKGIDPLKEQKIIHFLRKEIQYNFKNISVLNKQIQQKIEAYRLKTKDNKGLYYQARKKYDQSITLFNEKMAAVLDQQQKEAQQMYPHFFERYKTDGVEHNIYIGQSLTPYKSYHSLYLDNLRLWQLQVMCEMENEYQLLKPKLPIPFEVASLIFVYSQPLSIRFRIDEKRFDVDGSYNARYEIIKKRIDKAHVKQTGERLTQPGKMTIIYTYKTDEEAYLRYLHFLQTKGYFLNKIEKLEVEDLQGVLGLKALRIPINYRKNNNESASSKQNVVGQEKEKYIHMDISSS